MILSGDVKLLASQVMLDTPEGGGSPTSTTIVDGTSNGVFPDISELDRAGGRVNLRKTFAAVQTANTDGYFGANVIVAEPPSDPRVSVTLFSTQDVFDRRIEAQGRMESYLAQGPVYSGYLFGDHIAGMRVVTILQREEVALPVVGDTFALRAYEGTANEVEQYVRVTDIASTLRTFTDASGDFRRLQVVMDISDALRYDLPGLDALRYDSAINYTGKTKFFSTIVADAARYYGVVPLEEVAGVGDFTVKAEGIFTQLVPSTRIEVPIADARMNQQLSTLVADGASITRSLTLAFTTAQAMFIGGSILPSSLTVTRSGATITDKGGILYDVSNSQVGIIDYDNGILTLTSNVYGTGSGTHTVTYTPASTPVVVTESIGLEVTQQGQRLSWVVALDPVPSRRSLQVSFRALGRWYVLTEDGSGVLRGSDSAFGAGTLNYTTGTVSVTLGALPDVESRIILTWASSAYSRPLATLPPAGPALSRAFGKSVVLPTPIKPGTLTLTWNDGAPKSATDSLGALSGDATGRVDYATGRVLFRPNVLPAKNAQIDVALTDVTPSTGAVAAFSDGGSTWTFSLGSAVQIKSVNLAVVAQHPMRKYPGVDTTATYSVLVFDDGGGNLQIANITGNATVGTINYTNGNCTLNKSFGSFNSDQPVYVNLTPLGASSDPSSYIKQSSNETRVVTLTFLNGPGANSISAPAWAWWSGAQANAAQFRAGAADGSAQTFNFMLDAVFMPVQVVTTSVDYGLFSAYQSSSSITSFNLGSDFYKVNPTTVVLNPLATTGEGTTVGEFGAVEGSYGITLTDWTAGITSAVTNIRGSSSSAASGEATPMLVDTAMFRTAVAPLLNTGFQIAGTRQDGVTFSATANNAGLISTGGAPPTAGEYGPFGVFGTVDYETGVADIRFGKRVGASIPNNSSIIDVSELGIPDVTRLFSDGVRSDTLRYNAVGYAYLPLDPLILGLDPVRLPADGRVPIFRSGSFAVIGNTQSVGPQTVSNGQTINCARVRLSRVRVIGNNGVIINTGYTANLDAGTVTFTDVSGYSQPVTVEHRIEDMMLVSDAQINGQLTFTRPVTHEYPVLGTYVSSALIAGDLQSRVSVLFDQATWSNVWSNAESGSSATGTYNDALNPIELTNTGTLTERWALQFTNSTAYNVIGENVGVIATGNTSTDLAPVNPATGQPYFTLRAAGWGLGWATGNVLRFNTVGSLYPVWIARTILQGPETVPDDNFTLLIRGDVDNP